MAYWRPRVCIQYGTMRRPPTQRAEAEIGNEQENQNRDGSNDFNYPGRDQFKRTDIVGLVNKADMYPKRLSGGEQQRVAICRALAMEPEIMLFDEPTSALDPELVGEVLAAIKRLARQGGTMILVTHEMQFAKEVADTVVFMADHRVVESGAARQVLENPKSERAQQFLQRVLRPTETADEMDAVEAQGGDAL